MFKRPTCCEEGGRGEAAENQTQRRGMESRRWFERKPPLVEVETRDHLSLQLAEAYREGGASDA